ncbi:MAG: hypothetical protein Q9164_001431 [Protoblastenia rupestris]
MPPKAKNLQSDLTLRFKYHKTTVVLLCQQSQSFKSIKQDLLDSIEATGIKDIQGESLPSDPESIILGVPLDKNDIGKGWVNLEIPEFDEAEAKGKGVKKGSVLNQSPLGAGLKDGAVLAFKFQKEDTTDEMDLDDDWDVVMPSYEDEGGSQSQK